MLENQDRGLTRDQRILKEARRHFQEAVDAEREIREQARIDLKFRVGDQWKPEAKQLREGENRPCLTINRTQQFIHQVTNAQRKLRPALEVSPEDGEQGDRDSADIWQGLLRHIEVRSNAEVAYDTCFDHVVGNSFGFWRIVAEYAGHDTFDQELRIERVLDPFSIYIDPNAKEVDRSDMQWAFVLSNMSREEFERKYPNTNMAGARFYDGSSDHPGPLWVTADQVQIAEYWRIEFKPRTLQQLNKKVVKRRQPDDSTIWDVAQPGEPGAIDTIFSDEYDVLPDGVMVQIRQGKPVERVEQWPQVRWYKITATDILDEGDWPGKWIPILVCFGEEFIVDGKKLYLSLTRVLRDSQILYNVFRSQQAEVIGLTPKAPFIGYTGQFKSAKNRWETANMRNWAYLEADPISVNGTLAPLPQRNVAEPPIQAFNAAVMEAAEELKACSGIYDASLGAKSNETSGRAIFARKEQGDNANFHFFQNLNHAICHQGRMLMDLIPAYYDRRDRIIRIVKPDNTHEMVKINGPTTYKGKPAFFDPEVGRYDVSIKVGPNYGTQLEQAFQLMGEMLQSNPALWGVVGDLVMQSSPLPGSIAQEAAKRMKATLPPEVLAVSGGSDQPAIPPEIAKKYAQLSQMVDALTQQLNEKTEIIRTKQMEIDAKHRDTLTQALVDLVISEGKIDAQRAQKLLGEMVGSIKHERQLETQLELSSRQINAQQQFPPQQPQQPAQGQQQSDQGAAQ